MIMVDPDFRNRRAKPAVDLKGRRTNGGGAYSPTWKICAKWVVEVVALNESRPVGFANPQLQGLRRWVGKREQGAWRLLGIRIGLVSAPIFQPSAFWSTSNWKPASAFIRGPFREVQQRGPRR